MPQVGGGGVVGQEGQVGQTTGHSVFVPVHVS